MTLTEDYCSKEVTDLLVNKGFSDPTKDVYVDKTSYIVITHQLAMKWLRERHVIIVIVPAYFNSEQCVSWDIDIWAGDNYEHPFEDYPTYEEAVEAALKYALENLI